MTDTASKYIRQIDFATFNADRKRFNQRMVDRSNSDITSCAINYVRTPPNGGTPVGEHFHDYDQFMFLISGKMMVKIDGDVYPVGPGTLMIFPSGVPHHFWNLDEETIHITVMAPAPDPEKPREARREPKIERRLNEPGFAVEVHHQRIVIDEDLTCDLAIRRFTVVPQRPEPQAG